MRFLQQQIEGYPGAYALYACDDKMPAPVGFVWYRHPLFNTVELLYVFVHENFRRQGIATALLNELKKLHPASVIAGAQVNEISIHWCRKHGFQKTQNGWFLIPPRI